MRPIAMWVLAVMAAAAALEAQRVEAPAPVDAFELADLRGEWHEVAAFGSWTQRRCMRDIVFTYVVKTTRELTLRRRCGTALGAEEAVGVVRPSGSGGRLKVRFGSGLFSWLPTAWSDHWLLAADPEWRWCVIGDAQHQRLSVLSRTMAMDEAAMARAVAAARAQGFDVGRLVRIPQGPGSITR